MKKKIPSIICLVISVVALLLAVFTREGAISDTATNGSKAIFALSVIV